MLPGSCTVNVRRHTSDTQETTYPIKNKDIDRVVSISSKSMSQGNSVVPNLLISDQHVVCDGQDSQSDKRTKTIRNAWGSVPQLDNPNLSEVMSSSVEAIPFDTSNRMDVVDVIPIASDALTLACQTKNLANVWHAIHQGARPDTETLSIACESENLDIVRTVIREGAKPNENTLSKAVKTENIKIVRLVNKIGAQPDKNTLEFACSSLEILEFVLSKGAQPNRFTSKSLTILYEQAINTIRVSIKMEKRIYDCWVKTIEPGLKAEYSRQLYQRFNDTTYAYAHLNQAKSLISQVLKLIETPDIRALRLTRKCLTKSERESIIKTVPEDARVAFLKEQNPHKQKYCILL